MTSEQLQSKLDRLKLNFERLDELAAIPEEEFVADYRNVAAAIYLLQTSIQALIDVGSFLVAHNVLPTPRSSHQVFEHLEQAGLLDPGTAARAAPIVGFRNRVVHLYDRVDDKRVYEVLTQHRRDLPRLLDGLLGAIKA